MTTGIDKTLKVWDPHTGEEILTVADVGGPYRRLWFLPSGHTLVGDGASGQRVWDATPRAAGQPPSATIRDAHPP